MSRIDDSLIIYSVQGLSLGMYLSLPKDMAYQALCTGGDGYKGTGPLHYRTPLAG